MPRHECPGGHFAVGTTMPTTAITKSFIISRALMSSVAFGSITV